MGAELLHADGRMDRQARLQGNCTSSTSKTNVGFLKLGVNGNVVNAYFSLHDKMLTLATKYASAGHKQNILFRKFTTEIPFSHKQTLPNLSVFYSWNSLRGWNFQTGSHSTAPNFPRWKHLPECQSHKKTGIPGFLSCCCKNPKTFNKIQLRDVTMLDNFSSSIFESPVQVNYSETVLQAS
jgi:hypothetical protein